MKILINWLVMTLIILIAAYLLPGVTVTTFVVALLVALVLGIVNAIIKPILIILTLPINILTLGLFILVINALLVMLVAWLIPGFEVAGFWWAMLFSIVISVIEFFLSMIYKK